MRLRDPFFLAVIAAICGGSVPIAGKIGLEAIHPLTLNFIRFLCATVFLLPFVVKAGEFKLALLKNLVYVGVIGALNPILFIIALQYTQASVTPLIYAIVPIMTAIYSFRTGGSKLTGKQIVGMACGFLGVVLIVLLPLFQKGGVSLALFGNTLFLFAAVAFMFYGILSRKQQKNYHISPVTLTFVFCLASLVISAPFAIHEMVENENLSLIKIGHMMSGVYLGIVGTGIFYVAYQYALKKGTEVAASLFLYIQPIATLCMAWIFLGETITLSLVIGGVLAISGAKLASGK